MSECYSQSAGSSIKLPTTAAQAKNLIGAGLTTYYSDYAITPGKRYYLAGSVYDKGYDAYAVASWFIDNNGAVTQTSVLTKKTGAASLDVSCYLVNSGTIRFSVYSSGQGILQSTLIPLDE